MTLLAEYIPKHRRKLVGLEGETHFAGPLEDKILGLAHLGDAGEVSLDIGREYRNARTRKSLGHHLQRNGFSGSGGAGDQTMVICERERQPGGLFTLADENLLFGIGHLVVGCSHLHRLFARIGVRAIIIPHVARRLKPVKRRLGCGRRARRHEIEWPCSITRRKFATNALAATNFLTNFVLLLHWCNTCHAIAPSNALIACNWHRGRSRYSWARIR